jgi:hypothetical protein
MSVLCKLVPLFNHHELKLIEHALRFTMVCLDTEAEFLYSDLKPLLDKVETIIKEGEHVKT